MYAQSVMTVLIGGKEVRQPARETVFKNANRARGDGDRAR